MDTSGIGGYCQLDSCLFADINHFVIIISIRISKPQIINSQMILEGFIRADNFVFLLCPRRQIMQLGMAQSMVRNGYCPAVRHFLQLFPCHAVVRFTHIISNKK